MTGKPVGPEEFRRRVVERHYDAVSLHWEVRQLLETAVKQDRSPSEIIPRAVDMLYIQAFKSHVSAYELATLGLVEDASAIVRRSLELAVQSVYITEAASQDECIARAGRFLSFLWVKWPPEFRQVIPGDERAAWEGIFSKYSGKLRPTSPRWGPLWSEIFDEVEAIEDTEGLPRGGSRAVWAYLSNVAHGTPPALVHSYAQGTIPIHDDRLVSTLLLYGSMYSLLAGVVWNNLYELMDEGLLSRLSDRARALVTARASKK